MVDRTTYFCDGYNIGDLEVRIFECHDQFAIIFSSKVDSG